MNKKIAATMVCLAIVGSFGLFGCQSNTNAQPANTTTGQQPTTAQTSTTAKTADTNSAASASSTDEFSIMEVKSKDAASALGGFYLKRGDRLIALGSSLKEPVKTDPHKGYLNTYLYKGSPDTVLYTAVEPYYPDRYSRIDDIYMSYGDIPVPTIEADDLIVAFSDVKVPKLEMQRVKFRGISIGMDGDHNVNGHEMNDGWIWSSSNPKEKTLMSYDAQEQLQIKDSSGQLATDYYDLVLGEKYTASWGQGTKIVEVESVADCRYYVPENPSQTIYDTDITIEGTVTSDGYAVYDVSGLAPGIYHLFNGGLFEIV